MSIRAISNLFVFWALGLTLHLNHVRQIPPAPISALPATVATHPLILEKLLLGEYFDGGGFGGHYLELKPNHRFSYRLQACVGIASRNQGTWQIQGEVVVLTPEDRTSIGHEWLHLKMIPVTWKNKLYLVDENEMPSFCHTLYTGAPDGVNGHYERELPLNSDTSLSIPQRFHDFAAHGEVVTRVSSVDGKGIVTLEGTEVSRLKPGMHLCWRQPEGGWKRELRVLDVQQSSARAQQISLHEEHEDRVRPYDLFTTGVGYTSPASTGQPHGE